VIRSLDELGAAAKRNGDLVDKALAHLENTSAAVQGIREVMKAEQEEAAAARAAAEARRKATEEQRKATEAAREHKQALENTKQGLTQIGVAATAMAYVLKRTADEALDAFKQQQSAFLGLEAVATRTIGSYSQAKDAAKSLADDGMMSIVEASKAVQAGLASGFSLDETMNVIKTFKDSAAFNRQAGLEFGESVVRAMEGVRMGNSILSDSAGITKNLSQILKEAGFAEQDLMKVSSDSAVRRALYNGLLREGALFAGNAAKATETLAGAEAKAGTSAFQAKAAIGEALAPAIQGLYGAMGPALSGITTWVKTNPELARTLFLVVGGVAALTGALALATAAAMAFKTMVLGPLGWIVTGVGMAAGAFTGLAVSAKTNRDEQDRLNSSTADLMRQYDALRKALDDGTLSTDDHKRASEKLKDVLAKLFDLQPQMKGWFDEEGRLLDTATEKWDKYRTAVVNAQKTQLGVDIKNDREDLDELKKQRADVESKIRADEMPFVQAVAAQAKMRERTKAEGEAAAAKALAEGEAEVQDLITLAAGELDAKIAVLEAKIAMNEAHLDALNEPLDPKKVIPPPPATNPPPTGGDKMSAPLAAALEDLQDLQALEKTPDNLHKTLAKVQQILKDHNAELVKLGKARDLERMRDIALPQEITQALERITQGDYNRALEQLSADTTLKGLTPQQIRERLEEIRAKFADYLKNNEGAALQLDLRLKGATDDEIGAPFENWQKTFRQNENMGLYDNDPYLKLKALQGGLGLAIGAGDMDAITELVGQIGDLNAAIQRAGFDREFGKIAAAREAAFGAAAPRLSDLEKQLIDAEAAGDSATVAKVKQQMLDLVRPALEAQRDALRELLKDTTITAEQRAEVERELNSVMAELRQQDVDAHRIASEAKVAQAKQEADAKERAEREAQEKKQKLTEQEKAWLRQLAEADMTALRERNAAAEKAEQARIKGLQGQLEALERLWAAEDRREAKKDLQQELAAVMADTRFEKIMPDGSRVFTYDEEKAREIRERIADAERDEERAKQRESLQDQIKAAQDSLAAMQTSHQTQEAERQRFWQAIQSLDIASFADLTKAAEGGLDNWIKVFDSKLPQLTSIVETEVAKINAALASISNMGLPGLNVPVPTMPNSATQASANLAALAAAAAGMTVQSMQVNLPNVTNAQQFARELPEAVQREGFSLESLTRSSRQGYR